MAALIVSFLTTIRNNWKKSTLAAGGIYCLANYGKRKYREEDLRRQCCREAKKYGTQIISRMEKPVKVTVILNPMANHGKAKKLFEKNVAPLLYLAGFEVSVVKTEYEGQAKQYMDVLEQTDYIVVAGGDGTLMEVVTGLLRRKDNLLSSVPIGVIPLGVVNSYASSLLGNNEDELVRWLLDAGMNVVRGLVQTADVLKITSEEEKTVYALSGLDCGIYRKSIDRVNKLQKYWYLGGLKHRMTVLRHALTPDWPPVQEAEMTYTNTCTGCNTCRPAPVWRWWHVLFKPQVEDFTKIENTNCGVEHNASINALHLVVNNPNVRNDKDTSGINASVTPVMTRMDFFKHGSSLIGQKPYSHNVGDINQVTGDINAITITPKVEKGTENFYSIDNEDFSSMTLTLTLLKDRIRVFVPGQSSVLAAT